MKTSHSILEILIALSDDRHSRLEVNYLIEKSQSFAYSYLKYRYKNLSKVLLAEDATLQELAIDAIAPLFERDETGAFVKITKAFKEWEPTIETEEKSLFFLNRLVAKSVEKYVSELLRQSDPFFSKILDSVNYIIEKHKYKKRQILGTTFIVEDDRSKKIGALPDSQFIYDLPIELFSNPNKMLHEIINHIKSDTQKEAAIPLNALVIKIKRIRFSNLYLSKNTLQGDEVEIDSIIDKALDITIKKLQHSYINKGKITKPGAENIKKAICNVAFDIKNGGINPGLYKYYLEQDTALTLNDYTEKYKNVFEYLFKILKKEISNQLTG